MFPLMIRRRFLMRGLLHTSEPLKSSYSYDDIAREYLDGMMLPSKEDLLGKDFPEKALEEEQECLGNYACYQAFLCPCMARKGSS